VTESATQNCSVVGVDIGGANLKYCDTNGMAKSTNFPMWKCPDSLAERLKTDLDRVQPVSALAVTMTGELADCFLDRGAGVDWIVDHTMNAASQLGVEDVFFYGNDNGFHRSSDAKANPDIVAAANWHALASYAARVFPTAATVIDIGSTTTDIIPIADGRVSTAAVTDYERLVEGSLVYVGCRRTPICSLVDRLHYRGQECPVMNELFATIDDAMLVLQKTSEDEFDLDTADRRPRTVAFAANRMARMIGLDRRSVSIGEAAEMAAQVVSAAANQIGDALGRIHRPGSMVIAGHGQDLLMLNPGAQVDQLSDHIGHVAARCAPSFAVATLYQWQAQEAEIRCGG
jgi:probable H4MPT-linked C1 transfer pathway protein